MTGTQQRTISADDLGQCRIVPVTDCEGKLQNQAPTRIEKKLQVR